MEEKSCKVEGCQKQGKLNKKGHRYFPRGFCIHHYEKWAKENRDIIEQDKQNVPKSCSIEGCDNPGPYKRAMCEKHYVRFMKHGDANFVEKRREGQTEHPLYNTYQGIRGRCLQKTDKDYPRYGGRGVKLCERWSGVDGFFNFIEDMGERPEGYTIDRVDFLGDYSPENCRWADINTQALNRRDVKNRGVIYYPDKNKYRARISVDGVSHNLGRYKERVEAIQARKEAELKLLGYIIEVDEEV